MRRAPFRYRLTLWYVAVLAIAQLLTVTALGLAVQVSGRRAVDRELQQKARQPLRREDLMLVPTTARTDFRRSLVVHWPPAAGQWVWDPAGAAAAARGEQTIRSVWVGREHARVLSQPRREAGRIAGVVQVARPLAGYDEMLRTLVSAALLLLPFSLLLAAVGGNLLTRRALAPVSSMTSLAAEISVADLSRRLQVDGDDELAALARTFNDMIARLERAFDEQSRFLGDVAHELRSPLALIRASSSVALSGDPDPAEDRRALVVIDAAADGLGKMVNQMLLLARAAAGQLPVELAEFEAADLLTAAIRATPGALERVRLTPGPELVMHGDLDLLCRALVNLLSNGLRHTPAGRDIEVGARQTSEGGELAVVDHGEGLPAEHLQRATERFYRVDTGRSRQSGGSGLGLAIVAGIAAAHRGSLRLAPTPGGGLTARLLLPAAASDQLKDRGE